MYDVFISYSTKDQKVAEGICGYLEGKRIRCFVAYRDIPKGKVWARAIVEALNVAQMMIVVFSENFNLSEQVDREIEIASEEKKAILTFRISNDQFKGAKKYYLKNLNWIDAFPNPQDAFETLYKNVCKLLGKPADTENQNIVEDNNSPIPRGDIASPIKFIEVSGGEFLMGATQEQGKDTFEEELPPHKVKISSFMISESPITVSQYKEYCRETGKEMPPAPKWGWIDNHPIVNVSWFDANEFAKFYGYYLPTEAQWEFAAKGGNLSKHYKYSGGNVPFEIGWFADNTYQRSTAPVKTKKTNELGIYDMSGNVYEWCQNWKYLYSIYYEINPSGPKDGIIKSSRRGSWHSSSRSLRVTNRDDDPPEFYSFNVGFRVAKDITYNN